MPEKGSKKTWEKERRDRLKEAFTNLEKLLPSYDPSSASTRLTVLNKSIEYIQEMQNKILELLKPNTKVDSDVLQLRKLQDRIKKLVGRIELLTGLLREAKISIPNQGSSLKNFKFSYKWSGKISEKTASALQKKAEQMKENEKENKNLAEGCSDPKPSRKRIRNKLKSSSSAPKHRKNIINRSKGLLPKRKILQTPTSNCFIIYTQASTTQSCYLVTNAPSNNFGNTVITNSLVASNPLMCSNVKAKNKKSVIEAASALPTTLLLANGTLYPVQSQPILPAPMVVQVANNPMIIKSQPIENLKIISEVGAKTKMVTTKIDTIKTSVSSDSTLNKDLIIKTTVCDAKSQQQTTKLIPIKPYTCFTKTTHINNVPIPALTSGNLPRLIMKTSRKTKNKRIDNKPLSRQAIRRIRKLSAKRVLEEKKSKETIKTQENDDKQSPVDHKNEVQKIPEKNIDNMIKQQNISIISNEIIRENNAQIEMNKQIGENEKHDKIENAIINCDFQQNSNFLDLNLKHPENDKILDANLKNTENLEDRSNMCQMNQQIKNLDLNFAHSELSNDIFASLQVPTGCQNPDSTSPTAAFLLAFPLVSSMNVKTTETLDEENVDSQNEAPTILQIGTMDNKPTHDTLTSNLLNLDNLSFLSSKDIYSGLYTSFEQHLNSLTTNNFIPDLPKFIGNQKLDKIETKIEGNSYNIDNITGIFEEKLVKNRDKSDVIPEKKQVNYTGLNKIFLDSCAPVKNMEHVPTSQMFNFDSRNKNEENLNFLEKPKDQNTQFLQKNIIEHNCQLPTFMENKNFVPITSQTNFSHNIFNIDQNFPSLIQKNTNYKTPNFEKEPTNEVNSKTCFENKSNQKNTDFTFTFTLEKTQKEEKQTLPSYNMTYTNYDLNNFTKVCTTSFTSNKTFPDPLYTNSNNNSYNYYSTSDYLNDNCFKNMKNDKNLPSMDFENCIFPDNFQKTPKTDAKPTYNWMTTPKTSIDHILPPFSKEDVFSNLNNQFFNTTIFPETPKNLLNQKSTEDENQFTWSPTKMPQFLDPVPNFVSSTLPTLVGDLALNFNEQKIDKKSVKKLNCENQNTLFTVNQLVHKDVPAKPIRRRNSGSCNKNVKNIKKMKNEEIKNLAQNKTNEKKVNYCDANKRNSRNYTAEALMSSETKKNLLPSFIPDMFFPSVESDNFQQNFPPFPTFSTNNFIPSINPTDEFENINLNVKDKKKMKEMKISPPRKQKKKTTNEQNFVDYSFLTVPVNGNSPDEFHTNFLPPPPPTQPQLFPCKNPSYVLCCNITSTAPLLPPLPPIPTVTRARIQHPEISPSLNSAGTSLANFNLSTIFPEINKSSIDMFPKEQQVGKVSGSSVAANSKPHFSYPSCQNPQNFNNNR